MLKQLDRVTAELVAEIKEMMAKVGLGAFDKVIAAGGLTEPWTDSAIDDLREVRDELKGMLNSE